MSFPFPEPTPLSKPYWDALSHGHLVFQKCHCCGHAWLPARAECPECLEADWKWTKALGKGTVVSWVVYHHSYHPEFAARIPYAVVLVELDEGPRMITNIVNWTKDRIGLGQPVILQIEKEQGFSLARFKLTDL